MKKSSWIILALIVVLGLIYFFTKENQVSVGIKKLKLPAFAIDQVDRIEIKTKDAVNLVKRDGKWFLVLKNSDPPQFVRADLSNVTAMLDAALAVRNSHYVTNIKDKFKDLGLSDEEAVLVKVYSADAVVWNLVLGKNASGFGRYAKLPDDNDVHVVKGSFWQLTRNGPTDWRDREIMSVKEGEISSFKLFRGNDQYLSLVKEKDAENWQFDDSQKGLTKGYRVDSVALTNVVRAAVNLKASGFIDEKRDMPGPIATIAVTGEGKKHELFFYPGPQDNYSVKQSDDDQIYEVSKFNFDRINKSLNELRDLSMLNFDKSAVSGLTLMHGKDRISLVKKENAWQIDKPAQLPEGFEFDPVAVDDMVAMLASLPAQRIASSKDRPQNPNWQSSSLVDLSTDKGQKIQFYASKSRSNADEYLAKGNVDQEIYIVKASRIASLTTGLNAFKKEHFNMPPIDENTRGFESLPIDVQRKLLEAAKKKAH